VQDQEQRLRNEREEDDCANAEFTYLRGARQATAIRFSGA
jgi:hypothetical protein